MTVTQHVNCTNVMTDPMMAAKMGHQQKREQSLTGVPQELVCIILECLTQEEDEQVENTNNSNISNNYTRCNQKVVPVHRDRKTSLPSLPLSEVDMRDDMGGATMWRSLEEVAEEEEDAEDAKEEARQADISTFLRMTSTCRYMRDLRQHVIVENNVSVKSSTHGMKLCTTFPHIRAVEFETWDRDGSTDFAALPQSCKRLTELSLFATSITNLNGLKWCVNLRVLDLGQTQVEDIAPLAQCVRLVELDMARTKVSSIAPLAKCRMLRKLNLFSTKVSDLEPLRHCRQLRELDLQETLVSDVDALAGCHRLRVLNLNVTDVKDIEPLGTCRHLQILDLNCTQVVDISIMSKLVKLEKLYMHSTHVRNIAPLAKCVRLRKLVLKRTRVMNVNVLPYCKSLKWLALSELDLEQGQSIDISGLRECTKLTYLDIADSAVNDMSIIDNHVSLVKVKRGSASSSAAAATTEGADNGAAMETVDYATGDGDDEGMEVFGAMGDSSVNSPTSSTSTSGNSSEAEDDPFFV